MGLPANQLGSGERVVIETREHWKHLLGAGLLCLLAVAGLTLVLRSPPGAVSSRGAAGTSPRTA